MIIDWGSHKDGAMLLGLGFIHQYVSVQDDTELPDPTLVQTASRITKTAAVLIRTTPERRITA